MLPVIQLPLTRHGLLPPPAASYLPQAASCGVEFLPARLVSGRCLQQGESPVLGKVAVEGGSPSFPEIVVPLAPLFAPL